MKVRSAVRRFVMCSVEVEEAEKFGGSGGRGE